MSHYKVLGVPRDASFAVIRQAYLQKAKRYHPDVNQSPQADKLFREVQEAYQTLSNEAKRKSFDATHSSRGGSADASSSVRDSASVPGRRYRGHVYDPQKERMNFSRDFYEQAEALRRESQVNQSVVETFRRHARRVLTRLLWKSVPFVLMPLTAYGIFKVWRVRQRETQKEPILHDMYGRAYLMDKFGRRTRAPRYDNQERLAQWTSVSDQQKELAENDVVSDTTNVVSPPDTVQRPRVPRVVFDSLDRISATTRKLTDECLDHPIRQPQHVGATECD